MIKSTRILVERNLSWVPTHQEVIHQVNYRKYYILSSCRIGVTVLYSSHDKQRQKMKIVYAMAVYSYIKLNYLYKNMIKSTRILVDKTLVQFPLPS